MGPEILMQMTDLSKVFEANTLYNTTFFRLPDCYTQSASLVLSLHFYRNQFRLLLLHNQMKSDLLFGARKGPDVL